LIAEYRAVVHSVTAAQVFDCALYAWKFVLVNICSALSKIAEVTAKQDGSAPIVWEDAKIVNYVLRPVMTRAFFPSKSALPKAINAIAPASILSIAVVSAIRAFVCNFRDVDESVLTIE
jgi:hypothetical protein